VSREKIKSNRMVLLLEATNTKYKSLCIQEGIKMELIRKCIGKQEKIDV
jgi:hypothetical protein